MVCIYDCPVCKMSTSEAVSNEDCLYSASHPCTCPDHLHFDSLTLPPDHLTWSPRLYFFYISAPIKGGSRKSAPGSHLNHLHLNSLTLPLDCLMCCDLLMYSHIHLCTCPNYLNIHSLTLTPNHLTWAVPLKILISIEEPCKLIY